MSNDIFRIRRDNTTNWTNEDPTLGLGEIGYDTVLKKLKVGTGSTPWTVLDFVTAGIPDGTYGDIVVSGTGSTWNLSSALMTTINSKLDSGPLDGGAPAAAGQVFKVRRGTTWTGVVLNAGEIGYDTSANEIRIGDGATAWDGLDPIGLPKISSFTLDDLGDVTISGPANGDILTWNGSEWTNLGPPGPGSLSLNDLTNVSLSSPTNTQVLQFNGTNWVNTNLVLVPVGPAGGDLSGTFPNPTIATAAVTLGKLETRNRSTLLGVGTGVGTKATVEEITLGSGLGFSGNQIVLNSLSISDISGLQTALDNKVDDSQISAFGLTLIDDVDAATARSTLGLGTIATQNANNIAITGGTVENVTATTGTYSSLLNEAVLIPVRKASAGTITKGRPVYIVGSTGTHVTVELAQANTEATSAYTFGIAATDITTTSGFIMKAGLLTGLNNLPTATFADGDPIYLDETTAGGLRKTLPAAPNHGVFLGFVVKASSGSAGIMDVHIQNYQELEELSDVNISGIAADHFLKRNATNTRWENVSPADARTGLGLGTLATQNGTFSGTSSGINTGDQTITLTGDVTGSGTGSFAATIANDAVTYAKMQNVSATDRLLGRSSAGAGDVEEIVCTAYARGLLDDADAATARTTLGLGSTDTPTFAGISLANGEFLSNATDGRIDIGPNGTHPSAPSNDYYALTVDGQSWGFGVRLGTRNTRTNTLNANAISFVAPLGLGDNQDAIFGASSWFTVSHRSTGGQACLSVGMLLNNASSSGSMALVENNQRGAANRIPTTDHLDPTLYLYGRGSSNAAHYMRLNHDTTNGTIETGAGDLNLVSASGTINNNGNRIPKVFSGTTPPSAGTGDDGDLYFKY